MEKEFQTATRRTLLDYGPEAELRKRFEDFQRDASRLDEKVATYHNKVEEIFGGFADVPVIDISRLMADVETLEQELSNVSKTVQTFEATYDAISRETKQPSPSASAVDKFTRLADSQALDIEKLKRQSTQVSALVEGLVNNSYTVQGTIWRQLRNVAKQQQNLSSETSRYKLLKESFSRLRTNFQRVDIHKMPHAYHEALKEVARRRKFAETLDQELERFNTALSAVHKQESELREQYGTLLTP